MGGEGDNMNVIWRGIEEGEGEVERTDLEDGGWEDGEKRRKRK
jgi:hypothetical protein